MIEYRGIHKSFDLPVLKGVDLTVATGETVAIVGPSGCGKSVLLKTTIGLVEPDRGDVFIDGDSVFRAAPGRLRRILRKVGYVFQNAALFDSLDVYENVAMGVRPEEAGSLARSELDARIERALQDVNLDPAQVLHKTPAELSGGMRKRVGLARAIVGRPQIVLYDEPVTGLDPVNTATVARLIGEIGRRMGVTTVMVTHDVEGALDVCDRIALLHDGRLRFVGRPSEFRSSADPLVSAFAHREAAAAAALQALEAAPAPATGP
jgi:phospholipid/cholesterol/gamma-HCH transport system ATP-binding protein